MSDQNNSVQLYISSSFSFWKNIFKMTGYCSFQIFICFRFIKIYFKAATTTALYDFLQKSGNAVSHYKNALSKWKYDISILSKWKQALRSLKPLPIADYTPYSPPTSFIWYIFGISLYTPKDQSTASNDLP